MTPNRVTVSLERYEKFIPKKEKHILEKQLEKSPDGCLDEFMNVKLKSPLATLLFSIFLGGVSVDRFYLGDVGTGICKIGLRFVGLLFAWIPVLGTIVYVLTYLASIIWRYADIYCTYVDCKEYNLKKLTDFLYEQTRRQKFNSTYYKRLEEEK